MSKSWNKVSSLFHRQPDAPPPAPPKSQPVKKMRPVVPLNKTIIILDDELASREVLASELNKRGFTAIPMESKSEGYHWIVDNQPDLIISDIKSPRMDGFELLKMLKANPFTSDIPFIFLTAYSDHKKIDTAKEMGADEFILKPCNVNQLNKIIRRLLSIKN
jgi:CheY-like chemotaxis protein